MINKIKSKYDNEYSQNKATIYIESTDNINEDQQLQYSHDQIYLNPQRSQNSLNNIQNSLQQIPQEFIIQEMNLRSIQGSTNQNILGCLSLLTVSFCNMLLYKETSYHLDSTHSFFKLACVFCVPLVSAILLTLWLGVKMNHEGGKNLSLIFGGMAIIGSAILFIMSDGKNLNQNSSAEIYQYQQHPSQQNTFQPNETDDFVNSLKFLILLISGVLIGAGMTNLVLLYHIVTWSRKQLCAFNQVKVFGGASLLLAAIILFTGEVAAKWGQATSYLLVMLLALLFLLAAYLMIQDSPYTQLEQKIDSHAAYKLARWLGQDYFTMKQQSGQQTTLLRELKRPQNYKLGLNNLFSYVIFIAPMLPFEELNQVSSRNQDQFGHFSQSISLFIFLLVIIMLLLGFLSTFNRVSGYKMVQLGWAILICSYMSLGLISLISRGTKDGYLALLLVITLFIMLFLGLMIILVGAFKFLPDMIGENNSIAIGIIQGFALIRALLISLYILYLIKTRSIDMFGFVFFVNLAAFSCCFYFNYRINKEVNSQIQVQQAFVADSIQLHDNNGGSEVQVKKAAAEQHIEMQ